MEFIKITEQPSLYDGLDKKSVKEILEDINTEDHKVADAVQKAIPQIEKLVTLIIPRVKKGGRIFYMGAGTSGRLGVLDASEIPPTFGMPPTVVIGLIAGGDTALRNPVENAEDDILLDLLMKNVLTEKEYISKKGGSPPFFLCKINIYKRLIRNVFFKYNVINIAVNILEFTPPDTLEFFKQLIGTQKNRKHFIVD